MVECFRWRRIRYGRRGKRRSNYSMKKEEEGGRREREEGEEGADSVTYSLLPSLSSLYP